MIEQNDKYYYSPGVNHQRRIRVVIRLLDVYYDVV